MTRSAQAVSFTALLLTLGAALAVASDAQTFLCTLDTLNRREDAS